MTLSAVFFFLTACQKEDTLITGNEAPEDPTVSNILRENFIQKSYLNLIGRQPSDSEKTTCMAILNKNNCSVTNRTEVLDLLFNSSAYLMQLYAIENSDMLDGISDIELEQVVIYYQDQLNDPVNFPDYIVIQDKLQKSELLASLKNNLINGSVDLINAHAVIANSPTYENIVGSGSEWTTAVFRRFLFRDPTEKEIENCDEMFDHMSAIIFLKEGSSKDDLIQIFFGSDEYFEGQVRTLYKRYLFREPEADVETGLAQQYKQSHDYRALQKKILLTNEFLGIK